MSRLVLAFIALSGVVQAQTEPPDFAIAFPVEAPAGSGVFTLEVPAEAYAHLVTPDLRDLVVVDARGDRQSISIELPPVPEATAAVAIPLPPPIAMPTDVSPTPGRLDLRVQRDVEGRLSAVDLHAVDASNEASQDIEWLLDLEAAAASGYEGLRIRPDAATGDFRLVVDAFGSDDLVTWSQLGDGLPLLRASDGMRAIERLDLAFRRTTHRYVRLRPRASGVPLPGIAGIDALRPSAAASRPTRPLPVTPMAMNDAGRRFEFTSPGPLAITGIEVRVASPAGVHEFDVQEWGGTDWHTVARGTTWRIDLDGVPLLSPPLTLARSGLGRFRLVFAHPVTSIDTTLAIVPHRVTVVASGSPPYRLLVGSARERHDPVPLDEALAAIRSTRGEAWHPPVARVGAPEILRGATARAPRPDPGRWGLWGVLALGAGLIGVTAWRMLASAPVTRPDA